MMLKTILMIEDNPTDVLLLKRALARAGMHDVLHSAENATLGGAWLAARVNANEPMPDLILLDLNLPGIDGLEILKRLRSIGDLSSVPMVMYSSSTRAEDMALAKRLTASYYFVKPTRPEDFDQLVEVLKELVSWPDHEGWSARDDLFQVEVGHDH